jgi:hypothetical protein
MARAQSKLKVRYRDSQAYDKRVREAVELYSKSRDDALLHNRKVPSYAEVARTCNVPKETLRRRIAQLPSRLDVAATRGWLYEEEYDEGVKLWKVEVERRRAAGEKGRLLKPKKMTKKVWLAAHITTVGENISTDVLGVIGGDTDDEEGDECAS